MKKPIIIILFIFSSLNVSFAVDSLWVNYAPYTIYNQLTCTAIDRNQVKWIGSINYGLYKFTGSSWSVYDTTNSGLPLNQVQALAVDSTNILWIGTFKSGPYSKGIVKYNGINWIIYNTTNSGICSNQINYITVEKNNEIWIGTANGLSRFYNDIWTTYNVLDNNITGIVIKDSIKWISTTGGIARFDNVNWNYYTYSNSGLPSNIVFGIAIDSAGCVWSATQFGGVAKFNYSTNIWTVFNESNSGLLDNNTSAIAIDKDGTVWIATSSILDKYYNGHWVYYHTGNSGLPSITIYKILVDRYNNKWFTTDAGLAAFYPHGIIGINNNETHLTNYQLFQNYPNPFNPSTNIYFTLPVRSHVTIKVFDITGKEIKTLINESKPAGSHSVRFDASNISSGIYFYRIHASNQSGSNNIFLKTLKMIYIK
ncbi:MAG: two-component regulator propeller domain-containing protein [Ignavibacteria bacterium]|nr:two-component regulator propeller domain-containing protein [Ignavibacteria bacterium]